MSGCPLSHAIGSSGAAVSPHPTSAPVVLLPADSSPVVGAVALLDRRRRTRAQAGAGKDVDAVALEAADLAILDERPRPQVDAVIFPFGAGVSALQIEAAEDCAVAGVLAAVAAGQAQNRPLPDPDAFLREARKHLQTDYSLQRGYAYVETRRELKLDKAGRTTEESVKVIESYPGLPGEDGRWERVISVNGRPVPERELAEQDRERRRKAEEAASRLARQPAREQARQARERDERRVGEVLIVNPGEVCGWLGGIGSLAIYDTEHHEVTFHAF